MRNAAKMEALPKRARVEKRPLIHAPIPSSYASQSHQKVVYLGTKTPFMSAYHRVRKLLRHADKRQMQSTLSKMKSRQSVKAVESRASESVSIKATGKAIDKALGLALFIQGQEAFTIKILTGFTRAIDDVSPLSVDGTIEGPVIDEKNYDDLPESRVRSIGTVEIVVALK